MSASSSSTLPPTTTSSATPAASTTGGNNNNNDGPTSRPLLFFVALGFGVVFTNLWIIVGIKYCFRYNQRARQGLANAEDGERYDLGPMQRPRRRREKKLMSMNEVNERFPLTKYKVWRAGRETKGLSTSGGIATNSSRTNSLRNHEALKRVSTEDIARFETTDTLPRKSAETTALNPSAEVTENHAHETTVLDLARSGNRVSEDRKAPSNEVAPTSGTESDDGAAAQDTTTSDQQAPKPPETIDEKAEEDEEDPIRTAVPTDLLAQPGDACAICIEGLEDEDEVRGLSCGHAFHAGCVDPWLTSRRACCPLCKADYYVPKPRPEGEAGANDGNGSTDGQPGPAEPSPTWMGFRPGNVFRTRRPPPREQRRRHHHHHHHHHHRHQNPARSNAGSSVAAPQNANTRASVGDRMRRFYTNLPPMRPPLPFRNRNRRATAENNGPTPAQLEAGGT